MARADDSYGKGRESASTGRGKTKRGKNAAGRDQSASVGRDRSKGANKK
jgi:hypothetical protein